VNKYKTLTVNTFIIWGGNHWVPHDTIQYMIHGSRIDIDNIMIEQLCDNQYISRQ